MAQFKTTHFEVLAAVVHRMSTALNDRMDENSLPLIISNRVLDTVVDQLAREFALDNPLFNETLFRSQCGNFISKENNNG